MAVKPLILKIGKSGTVVCFAPVKNDLSQCVIEIDDKGKVKGAGLNVRQAKAIIAWLVNWLPADG